MGEISQHNHSGGYSQHIESTLLNVIGFPQFHGIVSRTEILKRDSQWPWCSLLLFSCLELICLKDHFSSTEVAAAAECENLLTPLPPTLLCTRSLDLTHSARGVFLRRCGEVFMGKFTIAAFPLNILGIRLKFRTIA